MLVLEQVEEDGQDSTTQGDPAESRKVYPLRSTFKTDGVSLKQWGLLRKDIHVYAVFYRTR